MKTTERNPERTAAIRRSQTGASFFGMVLLMVLIGLVLLAALRIGPAYVDNNIVVSAMERMAANNDLAEMSMEEIRSRLMANLRTNGIRDFDAQNVQLTRTGGMDYIDINYESRVPLFYNIEAVVIFENRFER